MTARAWFDQQAAHGATLYGPYNTISNCYFVNSPGVGVRAPLQVQVQVSA